MESKVPGQAKGYQKQIKKDAAGAQPRPKPKASHSTDYSSPTAKKWPLFVDALEKGNLDAVKQLIEEGINVNLIRDGVTPLMIAASKGMTEMAEIMLQAGANINEKNDDNWTALHKAAFDQAETGIVQFLMESGIEIETKNKSGKTALMLAEEKKHRDIVRVIRAQQAKLLAEARDWEDFLNTPEGKPYKLSRRYDSLSSVFMLWWVPVPFLACVGLLIGFLLDRSILCGVIGLVFGFCIGGSILLWRSRLRAYLDAIGPLSYLDIHMVRQRRKADEPIAIEKHSGPQSDGQGMDGQSGGDAVESNTDNFPLEHADTKTVGDRKSIEAPTVRRGKKLRIMLYIAAGLVVIVLIVAGVVYKEAFPQWYFTYKLENSGIQFSEQAFLTEVSKNNAEAVDLFIKAGANVAAKNGKGQTALMISAEKGYATILQKMITLNTANTAVLNAVDKNGNTALMIAARLGHEPIVKMLVESGADVNYLVPSSEAAASALQAAVDISDVKAEHLTIIQYLLQHGANAKSKNTSGRFPLLFAAGHGRTEVAKLLIEKGADVNDIDATGNFPLFTAACKGHSGLIAFLSEQGSNMKMASPDGQTPLMCAAEQGHVDSVKVLLSKEVMVDAKTSIGSTALTAASRKGNVEIARLLLEHGADPGSGYIPDSFANLPGKVVALSVKKNKTSDILKRIAKTASQDGYAIKVDGNMEQRTTITVKGSWNKVLQELAAKSRLLLVVNDKEVTVLTGAK